MIEVGRVCIKLAGRDAKLYCVITEVLDKTYVMIDGQTRRRKCNMAHLEPLSKTLNIKAKASHEDVKVAFKEMNVEIVDSVKKEKKSEKPKQKRKVPAVKKEKKEKAKPVKKEKVAKKVKAKITKKAPKKE